MMSRMVRGRIPMLSLAALLLFSGGARSGEETGRLLERAAALYADLNIEQALAVLRRAFEQPGNTRSQLVRLYHLSGLCLGALGRYQEAEDSFSRLLVLKPSFRLGADVAPRITRHFERVLGKKLPRLEVRLVPPAVARPGRPLVFSAAVAADPLDMVEGLRLYYRRGRGGEFSSVFAPLGAGKQAVTISPALWEARGSGDEVFWYAVAEGTRRSLLVEFGDAGHPARLEVAAKPPAAMAEVKEVKKVPWYKKWWVWTIAGGVVAAATTTAVVLSRQSSSGPVDLPIDFSTSP